LINVVILKSQKSIDLHFDMKVKNNKMLFNSKNWIAITSLISNSVRKRYPKALNK